MIDGKNFFDHPIKNYIKTHENIQKITTGQEDITQVVVSLDYIYFIKHYKMIAINLNKEQALDADPKVNLEI